MVWLTTRELTILRAVSGEIRKPKNGDALVVVVCGKAKRELSFVVHNTVRVSRKPALHLAHNIIAIAAFR